MFIIMGNDLRIEKTEAAIEGAFLSLVEEKGFANVQITEIAKRANVNRNTIYLRYGAKEDIVNKILEKTFQRQIDNLNIGQLTKVRMFRTEIEKIFVSIFTLLTDELEKYRIMLLDTNLSGYMENVLKHVKQMIFTGVKKTEQNEIIVEYILRGAYGIIRNWIIYDTGSIEENAKVLTMLVVSNARKLALK